MENYAFIFSKYAWQLIDDKERESQESYRTNMLPWVEDFVVYRPTLILSPSCCGLNKKAKTQLSGWSVFEFRTRWDMQNLKENVRRAAEQQPFIEIQYFSSCFVDL